MTTADLGADLAEHLMQEERSFLEGALAGLYRDEQAAKPLNEGIEQLRKRIKAFHEQYPDEPVIDTERGYAASFTTRAGSSTVDLISLAENSSEPANTLLNLARAGLLSCSVTGLRRLSGKSVWADEAMKYLMPGGSSSVLTVEKVD